MIYYTGDMVDHGIWETSVEGNIKTTNIGFDYFSRKFAKENIKFYPVIGNHEASPVNL